MAECAFCGTMNAARSTYCSSCQMALHSWEEHDEEGAIWQSRLYLDSLVAQLSTDTSTKKYRRAHQIAA